MKQMREFCFQGMVMLFEEIGKNKVEEINEEDGLKSRIMIFLL